LQVAQVRQHPHVQTLEDHLPDGGFGSWLMESLSESPALRSRLRATALDPLVCGLVGSQATLNRRGGLA
jgi:transketolase